MYMRKSFTICVHNETQGFEVVFKPGFGCTFISRSGWCRQISLKIRMGHRSIMWICGCICHKRNLHIYLYIYMYIILYVFFFILINLFILCLCNLLFFLLCICLCIYIYTGGDLNMVVQTAKILNNNEEYILGTFTNKIICRGLTSTSKVSPT